MSTFIDAGRYVEPLETRLLLAVGVSLHGTLVVTGGSGPDQITVRRDARRASKILASVNGSGFKFAAAAIKRIELYGRDGDDQLALDDSRGVVSARGATLSGGAGNDTLIGGLAGATFAGAEGDDLIRGSSKPDTISGDNGADTIVGGKGDDRVLGGAGNDLIFGSIGNDLLYGDQGDDILNGEGGDDTLGGDGEDRFYFVGQSDPVNHGGNDVLNGGDGNDWLVGGRQSSTLDDNNGRDTLTGGAGDDILDARGMPTAGNPEDVITDRQSGDIVPEEDRTRPATPAEIAQGEAALAIHIHANLFIHVNDNGVMRDVRIQGGIGDFADAAAHTFPALHVHDGQEGRLHMHDLEPHVYTLGEFFRVWGVSMSNDHIGRYVAGRGHTLSFTVRHNGGTGHTKIIADPVNYVIQGVNEFDEGDFITITYS